MEEEKIAGVKARSVLWYLTFFGFAMNYMIRINFNIAVVSMISDEFKGKHVVMSDCFTVVNSTNVTFYDVSDEVVVNERAYVSLEKRLLDYLGVCGDSSDKPRSDL